MHIQKAKFIVIEGIDRTGKTTICKRLSSLLPNTTLISFPNRKLLTGELINKYLKNEITLNAQTIHLLFSANRWEMQEMMLNMEGIVLCDRYYMSGIAYTAAKGIELEWCRQMDKGLVEPDLLVYIDLDCRDAAKREGYGDEKYEKIEYQEKVYKNFEILVNEYEGKKLVVNGNESIENITEKIVEAINKL